MPSDRILPEETLSVHWHVEGKNAEGQLLYSATVAAESGEVSGAPAAIAYACDRLHQNGYDARIVVTWVATLYCPQKGTRT